MAAKNHRIRKIEFKSVDFYYYFLIPYNFDALWLENTRIGEKWRINNNIYFFSILLNNIYINIYIQSSSCTQLLPCLDSFEYLFSAISDNTLLYFSLLYHVYCKANFYPPDLPILVEPC